MTEIKTSDLKKMKYLKCGDLIMLSGTLFTARDLALKRIAEEKNFPEILRNAIIFHAGPTEKNSKNLFSCGPTTAKRMDVFLQFLFENNLFATIGKGERDIDIHRKFGKIYFIAFGGLGSLYGSRIKKMTPILYKELKSEAIYRIEIIDFPVLVGIDSKGKSIFNRRKNDKDRIDVRK
ncbi:MAG: fumarate hydratase [bacterium (Candidatus Stahlbacteria) CG23_combo_of_CG06-09_8_20_14_all_34_7]|nr:MAG: fumarate hydratase [bacterium (Candidatus Stahlbacteria) CG23_combo_of_CG06-09_8_20_14_all_34_7]